MTDQAPPEHEFDFNERLAEVKKIFSNPKARVLVILIAALVSGSIITENSDKKAATAPHSTEAKK